MPADDPAPAPRADSSSPDASRSRCLRSPHPLKVLFRPVPAGSSPGESADGPRRSVGKSLCWRRCPAREMRSPSQQIRDSGAGAARRSASHAIGFPQNRCCSSGRFPLESGSRCPAFCARRIGLRPASCREQCFRRFRCRCRFGVREIVPGPSSGVGKSDSIPWLHSVAGRSTRLMA